MTAETLRKAAALIRERAEAAQQRMTSNPYAARVERAVGHGMYRAHAEHACAWTPDAALAVADWLDQQAELLERGFFAGTHNALAVARAYLGEQP